MTRKHTVLLPFVHMHRYLKAAKAGDVVEIRSECLKYGRSLAFATVDILNKNDGSLIAVGRHTKHVG